MGSRTWVKLYCSNWLTGTISDESISVRGVWAGLLALAGDGKYGTSGLIQGFAGVGYSEKQLCLILKISPKMWAVARKRLLDTGRITITKVDEVISICNWEKYQSEYERVSKYRSKSTTQSTGNDTGKSTGDGTTQGTAQEERRENVEKRGEKRVIGGVGDAPVGAPPTSNNNYEALQNSNLSFRGQKLSSGVVSGGRNRGDGVVFGEETPDPLEDMNPLEEEIESLKGWGRFTQSDRDWAEKFSTDYHGVLPVDIRECGDWWYGRAESDKKVKHTAGQWKTRLRNWLKRKPEFKGGGNGSRPRGIPGNRPSGAFADAEP